MRGYNKTIVCMIVLGMMMIPFGYTASAEETTLQGGIQTVHLNLKTKPAFSSCEHLSLVDVEPYEPIAIIIALNMSKPI